MMSVEKLLMPPLGMLLRRWNGVRRAESQKDCYRNSRNKAQKQEQPRLNVGRCLLGLVPLELAVLDAGLVAAKAGDGEKVHEEKGKKMGKEQKVER